MTSPDVDKNKHATWQRIFRGRSPGPLLGPWIACLVIGGAVFILEHRAPVLHDIVQPVYYILLVVLIIATARWMRARASGNRRDANRRQEDRRSDTRD